MELNFTMTTALIWSIIVTFVIAYLVRIMMTFLRPIKGKVVPRVGSGYPFFGQVFTMLKGSPWDQMALWAVEYGTIYILHLFGSDSYVVSDPELLKIIMQTKMSIFKKDVAWTYKPFLVILGNGMVTSEGTSWRKQRNLLSSHLRIDILDEIPIMSIAAVKRLKLKLDKIKKDGTPVEISEEFRHLTLQVITEAILSLPPGKSDETFAHMYLPIGTPIS
jgi:cytochrome P450